MNDDSIYNVASDNNPQPNNPTGNPSGVPRGARPIPVSQVYGGPQYRYYPPERPSWFFRFLKELFFAFFGFVFSMFFFLFLLGIMIAGVAVLLEGGEGMDSTVTEKVLSGTDLSPHKVAILPIEGVIQGKEEGFVRNAIRQASEDSRLSAIVLRINSPGGTMSGSDYYYSLLKDLKLERDIPVIVSMGALAASGGYYIATVGDKIFAERSTLTGSIGVIIPLYNGAELCEKIGIHSTAVTSGPMKGMGDFTKPMSPEEQQIWQGLVDSSYEQFLSVVQEGRPAFRTEVAEPAVESDAPADIESADLAEETKENSAEDPFEEVSEEESEESDQVADSDTPAPETSAPETPATGTVTPEAKAAEQAKKDVRLREIADGRIYTAEQAKELGLIDEIGFLDSAVQEAFRAAHIDESQTQVVRYKSGGSLSELFSSSEEEVSSKSVPAMIQNALSPEVYYICPRTLPY